MGWTIVARLFALLAIVNFVEVRGDLRQTNPSTLIPGRTWPPGSPWPLTQTLVTGEDLVTAAGPEGFEYIANVQGCEPLEWAMGHYNHEFLFGKHAAPDTNYPVLSQVFINLPQDDSNLCKEFPQFSKAETHEAYTLEFDKDDSDTFFVTIEASTVWGALRGIETLSQLWFTRDWESEQRHFYANVTQISDYPRFPHRGVLVDSARHYLKLSLIMTLLDAMVYNKFNVLHWHVVNDQSFPYVSKKFPELSEKGAYTSKMIYTQDMINQVLDAARLRGIRVLIEFGTPGHTAALFHSHPELITPCYGDGLNPGTANFPKHADYENLDPSKDSTYSFTKDLFTEIVGLSKDNYLHLGMDEVYKPCWESSPEISAFMKENGYSTMAEVEGHYMLKHIEMVSSLGVKPIMWEDPIEEGVKVPNDVVIQVWKYLWKNVTIPNLLDSGYDVLLSAPWYLNYIKYGTTWQEYYAVDPVNDIVPPIKPGQEKQVLGGEAAMWGELVDGTNLLPRLFPFSSAVAERLWSPPSGPPDDATWRLDQHRCRLLWRGIPAQPIFPGFCGPWEVDGDR